MYGVLIIAIQLDDTNKIRSAIGYSANIFTPVGPLSFTLPKICQKHLLMKQKHLILD